jgi:hypothetical protein
MALSIDSPLVARDQRRQRMALVLIGAWIMGSICSSIVAAENFYTIDRLLAASSNAAFARAVDQLGQPHARDFLRYLSSELNRLYFQLWNVAQLPLGALTLALIVSGPRAPRTTRAARVVGAMLAIVVLMIAYLTPAIVSLGRSLDFIPRNPSPSGMQRFWILHAAYTSLEMLKLAGGCFAAYWIVGAAG